MPWGQQSSARVTLPLAAAGRRPDQIIHLANKVNLWGTVCVWAQRLGPFSTLPVTDVEPGACKRPPPQLPSLPHRCSSPAAPPSAAPPGAGPEGAGEGGGWWWPWGPAPSPLCACPTPCLTNGKSIQASKMSECKLSCKGLVCLQFSENCVNQIKS